MWALPLMILVGRTPHSEPTQQLTSLETSPEGVNGVGDVDDIIVLKATHLTEERIRQAATVPGMTGIGIT